MIPINDLKRGIARSEEAVAAVTRVLSSGYWIQGPEHYAFEEEFAEFLNVEHVLGVASGTDALEIALRAVGCKQGSKVVTVANAGGYTSITAASIGCEVIYCDIDPHRLLMDPEALVGLLSKEISAVVVTHLYGNVAPVSLIKGLCDQFGIPVIEDCAQAAGATEEGVRVGTIGHIGTFSFYPTKNLGAIGDGGALATSSSTYAKRIESLRQYGWSTKYEIVNPGGMNSRLDEIQAAVLRIGLRHLDFQNAKRVKILKSYEEALLGSSVKLISSSELGNVAHLGVLKLPDHMERGEFRRKMDEYSIQTDIHYPILDCDQLGLSRHTRSHKLTNSKNSIEKIVSIPLFPELTSEETRLVVSALTDLVNCQE
jgi:dTDP-4-amino-4,6-dideoxygalactose transaminase